MVTVFLNIAIFLYPLLVFIILSVYPYLNQFKPVRLSFVFYLDLCMLVSCYISTRLLHFNMFNLRKDPNFVLVSNRLHVISLIFFLSPCHLTVWRCFRPLRWLLFLCYPSPSLPSFFSPSPFVFSFGTLPNVSLPFITYPISFCLLLLLLLLVIIIIILLFLPHIFYFSELIFNVNNSLYFSIL